MTTTDTAITNNLRLTVLKHLANGKPRDVVAAITGIPPETVLDIGSHHGYPDARKLSWAVDILTKKLAEQEKADLPPASRVEGVPVAATAPVTTASPATLPRRPAPPAPDRDGIDEYLTRAEGHESKRIRNAATKVRADLDRLAQLVLAWDDRNAERRRIEAEKEAARKEVEQLEAKLRAAKARLHGKKAEKPATAEAPPTLRAGTPKPKGEFPCRNDGCDQVITTAQGRSLHERMHCEHRAEQAS